MQKLGRWAPLSGVVFVALSIIGLALVSGSPSADDPDEEWLSYYADSGNRGKEIAVFFLFVIGALFLVWFATTLRGRLRAYESEPYTLSALVFGSGVAVAVLLLAGVSLAVGHSITIEDTDRFTVDPNVARLVGDTGFLFLVCSVMIAALLVIGTSLLALRTDVLPTWLGWVGLVAAVVQLVAALAFFPLFVFWAWVLVVSVTLLVRPGTSPGGREATPASAAE